MSLSAALKTAADAIRQMDAAPSEDAVAAPEAVVLFSRGGLGGMSLTGEAARTYGAAADALWKAVREKEILSKGSVDAAFQIAILQACDAAGQNPATPFNRRLDDAIKALKDRLTAPALKWDVHIPVRGLDPAGLPVRLAGVAFRTASAAVVRNWKRRSFSIIDDMAEPPDRKAAIKKRTAEHFDKEVRGRIFASVSVEAIDETAAVTRARRALRAVLDVINFYADLLYPLSLRAFVYALGERDSARATTLIFQEDQRFGMPGSREGPWKPFVLRDLRSKRARALGGPKIFRWLGSRHRNSFEQRVLTALQWAGRATADDRREEAFLLYLIALESLILGEKVDRELGYRLRIRCAHLLGRTAAHRAAIAQRLGNLYGIRSKIVHAGQTEVTDEDLSAARSLAKSALIVVLRSHVRPAPKDSKSFEDWFEARMLG
jgi:hypothetical protein